MKRNKRKTLFCLVATAVIAAMLSPLLFHLTAEAPLRTLLLLCVWGLLSCAALLTLGSPQIIRVLNRSRPIRRLLWERKQRPFRAESERLKAVGEGFFCPCCNTRFRDYLDFPYQRYPERYNTEHYQRTDTKVICPVCGSMPRHRILVNWLWEHLNEIRRARILHFAQEPAIRMWMDRNRVLYRSADLYAEADLRLNLEDTGLPSGSVPVIICNHVLEHVEDHRKALRELYRILVPDGMIIISFPIDPKLDMEVLEDSTAITKEERLQKFGQDDHLRLFGTRAKEMLESFGFITEEIDGSKMPTEIKPVVGPADYDSNILYLLRKPRLSGA